MANNFLATTVGIGQYLPGAVTTINLSVISANIQLSPFAYYRIWASVDCFFDSGTTNGTVATTASHPLTGKTDTLHYTNSTIVWLAALVSTGTGVLYISQIIPSGL